MIRLPVQTAFGFLHGWVVLRGTPGSYGAAGFAVLELPSRRAALALMREFPLARMPGWAELERGT